MATNPKIDLKDDRKMLSMTREERRAAQRKRLMQEGRAKRKQYQKKK